MAGEAGRNAQDKRKTAEDAAPDLIMDQSVLFRAELDMINRRRAKVDGQGKKLAIPAAGDATPEAQARIQLLQGLGEKHDLTGLTLSGGGIRSAAFCMGATQALDKFNLIPALDYLSTVSGGGYFDASFSVTSNASGKFEFGATRQGHSGTAAAQAGGSDVSDTPMVSHIRDHSNYLLRGGLGGLLVSLAIMLRGLIASALIILPYVLLAAGLTLIYNASAYDLRAFGPSLLPGLPSIKTGFPVSIAVTIILALVMLAWTLTNSMRKRDGVGDIHSRFGVVAQGAALFLSACLILEIQTDLLARMFQPGTSRTSGAGPFLSFLTLMAGASPVLLFIVNLFKDRLAKAAQEEAGRLGDKLKKQASRLTLLAASALLPLLLYLVYLALVYWGTLGLKRLYDHTPPFLSSGFGAVSSVMDWQGTGPVTPAALAYLLGCVLLIALTATIAPNSYSLHALYRDRLAEAFLRLRQNGGDPVPLDRPLSGLAHGEDFAPYHLFNTAINVHGSGKVNERGRNADFFLFSPLYAGSPATGYVPMTAMERAHPSLRIGSIVAISGAAASSNMGAQSLKSLSFTLAALNIRLGYWLTNPRAIAKVKTKKVRLFLWNEMISGLTEHSEKVYLTDGGHIENLGIYELLRRRCRLIIAIDGEADDGLRFGSFVTLQRYARIDLGTRIDLPWMAVAERCRETMAANADPARSFPECQKGPHIALGTISYDDGTTGYLLYVKSSISGDENDYIRDYGRRNPLFPHETTGDQFFDEEQFEVYRALGFHCVNNAMEGHDPIALRETDGERDLIKVKVLLANRGADIDKLRGAA
jgi:hypothetical protein